MIYLMLFLTFLKIGAVSFGGGYGMISLIKEEVVLINKWASEELFLNLVAVSESSPGPIAVNMATFIGSTASGNIWGSLLSTSLLILTMLALILFTLFSVKFSSIFYILIGGFIGFIAYLVSLFKQRGKSK